MIQYEIIYQHLYKIFHHVIQNWIYNDKFAQINFYNDLQDEEGMKKTSQDFANDSFVGFFTGYALLFRIILKQSIKTTKNS